MWLQIYLTNCNVDLNVIVLHWEGKLQPALTNKDTEDWSILFQFLLLIRGIEKLLYISCQ